MVPLKVLKRMPRGSESTQRLAAAALLAAAAASGHNVCNCGLALRALRFGWLPPLPTIAAFLTPPSPDACGWSTLTTNCRSSNGSPGEQSTAALADGATGKSSLGCTSAATAGTVASTGATAMPEQRLRLADGGRASDESAASTLTASISSAGAKAGGCLGAETAAAFAIGWQALGRLLALFALLLVLALDSLRTGWSCPSTGATSCTNFTCLFRTCL